MLSNYHLKRMDLLESCVAIDKICEQVHLEEIEDIISDQLRDIGSGGGG